MRYELIHADCRDVLANMGDDSVDSIVCDPPYHLTSIVKRFATGTPAQFGTDGAYARASRGFMGQTWDGGDVAFDPALWAECLRVLKPGGYLLAFSGTRTYHRMACAIDDAGFEIRDMISWLYGSGFPKSHDVSKAIDKAAGAERSNDAATPEAQQWAGWGTALKPACEPICMARKPLIGTVAANVLAHGTGGINIDGCRVAVSDAAYARNHSGDRGHAGTRTAEQEGATDLHAGGGSAHDAGRFPANVCHDGSDEVVAGFPQTTVAASGPNRGAMGYHGSEPGKRPDYGASSGSAARFFYCAKASRTDRNEGLTDPGPQFEHGVTLRQVENAEKTGNTHPTVKPEALMRWLCRMVTPPGGLVFDPFTGSGSTGKAAMLEGFRFLGAEMTAEYIPIARARIDAALTHASN